MKIWTDLSSVLSQYTPVPDRQTDRRTEFSSLYRVRITCSAVKTTVGRICGCCPLSESSQLYSTCPGELDFQSLLMYRRKEPHIDEIYHVDFSSQVIETYNTARTRVDKENAERQGRVLCLAQQMLPRVS